MPPLAARHARAGTACRHAAPGPPPALVPPVAAAPATGSSDARPTGRRAPVPYPVALPPWRRCAGTAGPSRRGNTAVPTSRRSSRRQSPFDLRAFVRRFPRPARHRCRGSAVPPSNTPAPTEMPRRPERNGKYRFFSARLPHCAETCRAKWFKIVSRADAAHPLLMTAAGAGVYDQAVLLDLHPAVGAKVRPAP
jgi:hypothetical protein